MSSSITVISWPISGPIYWLHWPLHTALARACQRETVEIKHTIHSTDASIQAAFVAQTASDPPILALSQPLTPTRGGLDFRIIPLLWRLPHWDCRRIGATSEQSAPIACLPVDTTSGRYVRSVLFPSNADVLSDLTIGDDGLPSASAHPRVVSIFPLHELDPQSWIRTDEYVGPAMDVTALMIPADRDSPWTNRTCARLFDHTMNELRQVLHKLYQSRGTKAEIRSIVESWERATPLNGRQALNSSALDGASTLISNLVRRGAYFPYHVLPTILAAEARRHLTMALERFVPDLILQTESSLASFLGGIGSWEDLPIGDRVRFLKGVSPDPDRNMHDYLSHSKDDDLKTHEVITGPSDLRVALHRLRPNDRTPRCETDKQNCLLTMPTPSCFPCHVIGRLKCLLDEETIYLRDLNVPASAEYVIDNNYCFLCRAELRPVTELFAKEFHKHKSTNVRLTLENKKAGDAQFERVVYVISCKLDQQPTGRVSTATEKMKRWGTEVNPNDNPRLGGTRFYVRDEHGAWKPMWDSPAFPKLVEAVLPGDRSIDFAYIVYWEFRV